MTELSDYVTVAYAADVLRLHPETVKRLCRQGDLAATKIGNSWLIHKDILGSFTQTYNPGRGPGSRFRRIQEEAARYLTRQLSLDQVDINTQNRQDREPNAKQQ